MATTTNYGWETPDDTDLVKDGAAAIRTLGNSVDTTTKNLNPQTTLGDLAYRSATANVNTRLALGTANQVLRVNSGGTAPEWATTADQTPLTTKGDLFGFDTADARIPIGTNGHILTADSSESLGLKWAAPASATLTLSQIATGSMSGTSVSISSLTSYDQITVFIDGVTFATSNSSMRFRLNGSSSSIYNYFGGGATGSPSVIRISSAANDGFKPSNNQTFNSSANNYVIQFTNCKASGFTYIQANYVYLNTSSNQEFDVVQGWFASSAAVSSIEITNVAGNTFNGGTYYVIAG